MVLVLGCCCQQIWDRGTVSSHVSQTGGAGGWSCHLNICVGSSCLGWFDGGGFFALCFCCKAPSGKGFKATLPVPAEGQFRSSVTEAGGWGHWWVAMHKLAPAEEGKAPHHLWGCVNALSFWLVTFDQSIPCTAAPVSHQSTVSRSCWFEMILWSISSFVQPLMLLLCLVSLLGLCSWSSAFLCSLPMWFVPFPEGLSLLASLWLLGGRSLGSEVSRVD